MASESPWVLVASGDAGRRMTLFRLLEHGGLRATVVDDGHDALAMLREEPFDAVVLDVLDVDLDAEVVVTGIRADPRLQRLAVLVMDRRRPGGPVPTQLPLDGPAGTSPESVLLRQRLESCLAGQPVARPSWPFRQGRSLEA